MEEQMNEMIEQKLLEAESLEQFFILIVQYQYPEDLWSDELKAYYEELLKKPRPLYPGDLLPNRGTS